MDTINLNKNQNLKENKKYELSELQVKLVLDYFSKSLIGTTVFTAAIIHTYEQDYTSFQVIVLFQVEDRTGKRKEAPI